MPSQDVWIFIPESYRTLAPWGRCTAGTSLHQLISPSRASGIADHLRSLDDLLGPERPDMGFVRLDNHVVGLGVLIWGLKGLIWYLIGLILGLRGLIVGLI